MDVGTTSKVFRNLGIDSHFVTDYTNDDVVRVPGQAIKEAILQLYQP